MVVLGWEARCGNDYVSFSGRELYTATVLACAEGDLIMNTRLTVKRTQNEPQLRVSRTSKKDVTTTIQIAMTTGASNNDLETHGKEAMSWAADSNDAAVPTEMPNSRPQRKDYPRDDKSASADNRPETINSRPSDDRMQPIGHVYHDRASPSDTKGPLAPLIYANAGRSTARG